jgi:hypothetical protein
MSYLTAASITDTDLVPMIDPGSCECGSHACYECRRLEIDIKALAIVQRERDICRGMMSADKVETHAWAMAQQYRCNAINALAFEDVNGELI